MGKPQTTETHQGGGRMGGRVLGMFLTFCWLVFGLCSGSPGIAPASAMKYLLDRSQALMVLLSPCCCFLVGEIIFLPFLSWGRLTISCLSSS